MMSFKLLSDLCWPALICTTFAFIVIIWVFFKLLLPKGKVGEFHKKYVLITGCDTGFGKDTVIRLDEMGFHVFATCLTREGKENLEAVCSERVVGLLMDVTNSKQIQEAYEEVKHIIPRDKGLWALVNNAGYMGLGPLEWYKLDDYKRMADVNLWGLIDVTKTFLPLVKTAKGRVVNYSSTSGLVSADFCAPYSVTKYGVEAFSDVLRRETAPWGIKVSILEPQAFKTPLWSGISKKKLMKLWDGISDEMKQEYGEEFRDGVYKGLDNFYNAVASPHTYKVIDTVIDAVTSRDPQPRYAIGSFSKVIGFVACLPTAIADMYFRAELVPKGAQESGKCFFSKTTLTKDDKDSSL